MSENKIDFVIIWVDGGDKEWQKQRNIYAGKDPEDLADYRFRDWEILKYWFRGVEKFAPWVNNVYFVTCGHYPKWLILNCPKLKFVKHEDYIPKEYLPTFSSHTIELNIHRIKGLSENFVYFNDDFFITKEVSPKFFFKDDMPCISAGLNAIGGGDCYSPMGHILLNNACFINRHFTKKDAIEKNITKWINPKYSLKNNVRTMALLKFYSEISSFYNSHSAASMKKSVIEEIWKIEPELFETTCSHKFRNRDDVNQFVYSNYMACTGKFIPRATNVERYFNISSDNTKLVNAIKNKKYNMICLNDTSRVDDFEKSKKEIIDAFECILPEKSSFEV